MEEVITYVIQLFHKYAEISATMLAFPCLFYNFLVRNYYFNLV